MVCKRGENAQGSSQKEYMKIRLVTVSWLDEERGGEHYMKGYNGWERWLKHERIYGMFKIGKTRDFSHD